MANQTKKKTETEKTKDKKVKKEKREVNTRYNKADEKDKTVISLS